MRLKFVFNLLLLPLISFSAIPTQKKAPKNIINQHGAVSGGVAGGGFSMLKVQLNKMVSQRAERIVFEVGDLKGKSHKGLPGFYHAQLTKNPPQLVIDFAQMPNSKVFESDLAKILRTSEIISGSKLISDPIDKSLTVILPLHRPAKMKVLQVKGQKETSKVVIDLF